MGHLGRELAPVLQAQAKLRRRSTAPRGTRHLFLGHEAEDLASFLQVAILNGWGGYILTQADYVNAFFSHDEYIDFFAELDENLAGIRKEFGTVEHQTVKEV